MNLKPVPGFKSLETHHCITGSLRHIYEFHGYPISEDLLLGLGTGVGFVYWQMKGTAPFLGGRANVGRPGEEGLEKTAGRRTGVQVETYRTGSSKKAEAALLKRLSAGEPVMLQVDMGFLPYFNFPQEYHFGGHAVVAAGYDPETCQVLIADRDLDLHRVSLADLEKARGSRYKPFSPQNTWFQFDFAKKRSPLPGEVRQAIRDAMSGMLEPAITNLGVKGIRKAARRIRHWPDEMSHDELRYACFNTFIFIDAAGGTGGGLFRYMYGRFLKEAAALTGERRLEEVGESFHTVGDRWQAVAEVFRQASGEAQPGARLPEACAALLEIADLEQASWEELANVD